MSPDEHAALSSAAMVLDTGTAWKPSDFWDMDQDWQDALATAANAFPRLVAEVLRLQADARLSQNLEAYAFHWALASPAEKPACAARLFDAVRAIHARAWADRTP